jgi:Amt family ammonium transporter
MIARNPTLTSEVLAVNRRLTLSSILAILFITVLVAPTLAAPSSQPSTPNNTDWTLLAVGLTFLLPIGLILLSVAALHQEEAASAIIGGMVAWGLAVLAYFAVGFAFQFGGIAVAHDAPDLAGLYWEYSLLDTTWGTGWGMIGLKGFLMLNEADTPGALALLLSQIPLVGVATLILYFALQGRTRRLVLLLASLLMGSLIYPVIGNWAWGGGWLANLGSNLTEGHGLIDAAGSGQVALMGASAALAALVVFRANQSTDEAETPADEPQVVSSPMPPMHLPLVGLLGAILMTIGWTGMAFMSHQPTAVDVSPAQTATNLTLSAFGGALSAGLYSWFTTSHLNPLMSARGLVTGLVVAAAVAPFAPAWSALAVGLVMGLLLPLFVYLFDQVLHLDDTTGGLAIFGVPGLIGLMLPGLLASGRYGAGWNGVGAQSYLGVEGQGVSGLLVAPGFALDWPGQMYAQLVGIAAISIWSFGLSWLLLRSLEGIIRGWERTGLEFGAPPKPVESDDEFLEADEDIRASEGEEEATEEALAD